MYRPKHGMASTSESSVIFVCFKCFSELGIFTSLRERFHVCTSFREKCPYSEYFWSIFLPIWTKYGDLLCKSLDLLCKSLYSVQNRENMGNKISKYGQFYALLTTELSLSGGHLFNFSSTRQGTYSREALVPRGAY